MKVCIHEFELSVKPIAYVGKAVTDRKQLKLRAIAAHKSAVYSPFTDRKIKNYE
jgi:hypothetical protein